MHLIQTGREVRVVAIYFHVFGRPLVRMTATPSLWRTPGYVTLGDQGFPSQMNDRVPELNRFNRARGVRGKNRLEALERRRFVMRTPQACLRNFFSSTYSLRRDSVALRGARILLVSLGRERFGVGFRWGAVFLWKLREKGRG